MGLLFLFEFNQYFLSTDFTKNPSRGNRSVLGGQMDERKEERTQGTDVRTDGWTNGYVQADREIDIMKLTFIFLNIANASKEEKNQSPSIRHKAVVSAVILSYLEM
jgi:hypothetical protein